jgi:hypothetical protein
MTQQHRALLISLVTALTLSAGCAVAPSPVPMLGPQQDIAEIAGEWTGYYHGEDSHRTGSISLSLKAGDTTAFGDIVMVPRAYERHEWERGSTVAMTPLPRVLEIMFVRVTHGRVSGVLDPYMDPDCDCLVVTTFTGRLTRGNTIQGDFTTRIVGTAYINVGRWEVKRRAPKPH